LNYLSPIYSRIDEEVQDIFNGMAEEYDDLSDLWHSWFFSRLHYFIANKIIDRAIRKKVLDIGCGTGFQSYLYSAAGYNVIGIDIAEKLLKIAKEKKKIFNPNKIDLFPEYYDYVKRYNQKIRNIIKKKIGKHEYLPPKFYFGDAKNITYNDNYFDHINCCGSTLSFVMNHNKAISEMARVLKPGGTFFVEVEHKWNFNFLWYILDPFVLGRLQFNKSIRQGLRFLTKKFTHNICINFPFGEYDKPVNMNLKLYTSYSLKRDLMKYRLKVEKKFSINSLTNLIPCTFLDCLKPSKKMIFLFKILAKLEEKIPIYVPGSSLIYYGKKIN
jgi:ubiquinone/menaquinone biosynthesis C-methylase UbiE